MTNHLLLRLCHRFDGVKPASREIPCATASLTYDQRQRSRLRIRLDDGREAGIQLARGQTPGAGDWLMTDAALGMLDALPFAIPGVMEGEALAVQILAAPESLSRAHTRDAHQLARACYHLGNRHVALQIGDGELSWLHDHVLDEMVRGLGLRVEHLDAPFEPEPGAYGGGHGHHAHGEDSDHGHEYDPEQAHSHGHRLRLGAGHHHSHSHSHSDSYRDRQD